MVVKEMEDLARRVCVLKSLSVAMLDSIAVGAPDQLEAEVISERSK